MRPTPLLLVGGPPASGKSSLARRLAADLRLPLLSRDAFKERLFDTLGTGDRDWSKQLGAASYAIVWTALESNLAVGSPTIVESTLRGTFPTQRIRALAADYPLIAHQLNCVVDGPTLLQRHTERSQSPERHPGHQDDRDDAELRAELLRGRVDPLPLDGDVIEVDTTDFAALDYAGLLARVRALLLGPQSAQPQVDGLDHLVLTVRDLDTTREWYTRILGMGVVTFDAGRLALTFGEQRINLHQAGREFEPKSARPTPGSGDLCFYTTTPLDQFADHLAACGVPIELGPVPRAGAVGPLRSLYLRDPDANLIEVANRLDQEETA